ncbi:MAG: ZIP family metal transporter [Planctomycetaceae bacterium]|jgi:ZIP family zinc transporter|nr:ZIP family metal transporter [Planctomycetaceae bacterium]
MFFELAKEYQTAVVVLAVLSTWAATALGASVVFFFQEIRRQTLDLMLGFAGGVMIAASFWSLLAPSIKMSEEQGMIPWVPALVGFLAGGGFLWCVDKLLPHLHPGLERKDAEGISTHWRESVLLVLAITLHNIPEGLAVGVAFGAVLSGIPTATITGAVVLALGIAIQNIPEGMAVSVPLRRQNLTPLRCFWYGQLSGVVEPLAALVGILVVVQIQMILPYALAFAAGAMIYVVVEELIPASREVRHSDAGTIGAIIGFAVMMTLDVALG